MRTLFEDATLLAWMAIPDDSEKQAPRVIQVLLDFYRTALAKGKLIPPDAVGLLRHTAGKTARKPPSWEDRVRQLDADEAKKSDGTLFWGTHTDHVDLLNGYVHSDVGAAIIFPDSMTRELLGFQSLVYGHQYLSLSIVSIARLSNQNALAKRAQEAYDRIHHQERTELYRLLKP